MNCMNCTTSLYKSLKYLCCFLLACFALAGCAGGKSIVYRQIPLELCPSPLAPNLPKVQGELSDRQTVLVLLEREKQVRSYIARLRKSLECYEKQVRK